MVTPPLFSRPPLSRGVLNHFRAMLRRRDWLEGRCAVGESQNRNLSYDEAELAAIKWALRELLKKYGVTEEEIPLKRNVL
jgi:hypothetical protein